MKNWGTLCCQFTRGVEDRGFKTTRSVSVPPEVNPDRPAVVRILEIKRACCSWIAVMLPVMAVSFKGLRPDPEMKLGSRAACEQHNSQHKHSGNLFKCRSPHFGAPVQKGENPS